MAHWVPATDCESLRCQQRQLRVIEGRRLALFHVAGEDFAIENRCPHRQGPVGAGQLEGTRITCPWHDRTFDLRGGACLSSECLSSEAPTSEAPTSEEQGLRCFRVRREGRLLLVDLDSGGPSPGTGEIFRYLVRYGIPGHVAHVGAPRRVDVRRGDLVLLQTDRGREVGCVLVAQPDRGSERPPTGELLRPLRPEEVRGHRQPRPPDPDLLDECRRQLRAAGSEVAVLDGEVLFEGTTVVLYHLGTPTAALGKVASDLSRQWPQWRIQFERLDPAEARGPSRKVASFTASAAGSGTTGSSAERETSWERLKAASRNLRGSIQDELFGGGGQLSGESARLLQFHGVYRQRHRHGPRTAASKPSTSSTWTFMVRVAAPGGRLTARQFQELLNLADLHGDGTLRLTSRQGVQLHGIEQHGLRETLRQLERRLLRAFGSCGDTNRNVMACPAPLPDPLRRQLQAAAGQLATHFAPRSAAWFEIWIDQPERGGRQPWGASPQDEEPVYGPRYLPRKLKIALAPPGDNCVDIYTQDIGLLATRDAARPDRIEGFQVLVGGGMGVSPERPETFPRLAEPLGYCRYGDALPVVSAIVELFRDRGCRTNRRLGRLKYLVADWGIDRLRDEISSYLRGVSLAPSRNVVPTSTEHHLGWHAQGEGRWFLGLHVENGRVGDNGRCRLKTGLAACMRRFQPAVRLTPQHNLLLCKLEEADRPAVERLLRDHGIEPAGPTTSVRRWALACPALPSCGLAVAEAERIMPVLLDQFEQLLRELGLDQEPFAFRLTGCPNGCTRPYVSEIGLVGRAVDRYDIWVGGSRSGDRLARVLARSVPSGELIARLQPLLRRFGERRRTGESLGDFFQRTGNAEGEGGTGDESRDQAGAPDEFH